MSRSDADGSRLFCGSLRLEYGIIQQDHGGNSGDGTLLNKEEEEEAHRQGEQVSRGMKHLGCAMVLLLATIITRRLLTNIWNSWCVVMIIVVATKAGAQDLETPIEPNKLPAQVLKGMDSHIQPTTLTPLIVTNQKTS